jgi:phosphoglucosamine mutase
VRYAGVSPLVQPAIQSAIAAAAERMRLTGRVLIRASGTEPLIRVMAEGEDFSLIQEIVDGLCMAISRAA